MRQSHRPIVVAMVSALLTMTLLSGAAEARVKFWYKSRAGYDSNGRTTLNYCAAVKRRTAARVIATAGILGTRNRIPFRTWPRAGAGYPGLSYRWGPRFPFRDWWILTFRPDGQLRMSYESGALLDRVSRRTFQRRCW